MEMMQQKKFIQLDRIIHQIYEAALNPLLWPQILAELVVYTQSNSAIIVALDQLDPNYLFTFSHNIPESALKIYRDENLDTVDMQLHGSRLIQVGIGKSALLCMDYDQPQYDDTLVREFYEKVLLPSNVYYLAGILLEFDKYRWTGLALHRPKNAASYTKDELEFLEEISVHIRRSLQVYRQVILLKQQKKQVYAALDCLKFGVIVLNEESTIIYTNQKAKIILEKSTLLELDNFNKLKAPHKDQALLNSYILGALSQSSAVQQLLSKGGVMGLADSKNQKQLMLSIIPLSKLEYLNLSTTHGQKVAIFLSEPNQPHELAINYLKQTYKLSNREIEICELFVNGYDLKEIAEQCHVTYETIRFYFKNIYGKTGCTSQPDLLQLLLGITVDFKHIQ